MQVIYQRFRLRKHTMYRSEAYHFDLQQHFQISITVPSYLCNSGASTCNISSFSNCLPINDISKSDNEIIFHSTNEFDVYKLAKVFFVIQNY